MLSKPKRFALDALARSLHASGWLERKRSAGRLTVATFHRVLPEDLRRSYPLPGLAVTPEELSWFLAQLASHYTCGPLETSVSRWRDPSPDRLPPLAITFDDCTADSHRFARAVLAEHGVSASFFAPAQLIESGEALWHDRIGFAAAALAARLDSDGVSQGWLAARGLSLASHESHDGFARKLVAAAKRVSPAEREAWLEDLEEMTGGAQHPEWARLMSWQELRELAADGHRIGSHSLTHALLPQLDADLLRHEVEGSRALLRERVGTAIECFCYPNGDQDPAVVEAVRRAGYTAAVTTLAGTNPPEIDPLLLNRFDMRLDYVTDAMGIASLPLLLFRLSGLHPAA